MEALDKFIKANRILDKVELLANTRDDEMAEQLDELIWRIGHQSTVCRKGHRTTEDSDPEPAHRRTTWEAASHCPCMGTDDSRC